MRLKTKFLLILLDTNLKNLSLHPTWRKSILGWMSFLLRKISQPPLRHFFLFYSQEDQGCGSLSASFPPQWALNPPHSSTLEKRLFTDYNMGAISDLAFWTNPQTLPVNRGHWASEFKSRRGVRWGVCTQMCTAGERGEKSQTKTNLFLAIVGLLEIWGQRKWISLVSLIQITWSELSTSEILGWLIATGWPDPSKGTLLN